MIAKVAPPGDDAPKTELEALEEAPKKASNSARSSAEHAPPPHSWGNLGDAAGLPRVDVLTAAALNRLYRAQATALLELRGVPCLLSWKFQKRARAHERKYRFTLGKQEGFLGVDSFAESILHGGERHAGLLPRELRYLLIADALHPMVQRVEAASGLRFEWDPSEADEERLCIYDPEQAAQFTITRRDTGATCGGFIQLANGATLATAVTPFVQTSGPVPSEGFNWLTFPVHCEIGSTRLPLSEMRGIESGDIISIDESRSSATGLFINMKISGQPSVQMTGLGEGTRITIQSWKEDIMKPGNPPPAAPAAESGESRLPPDRLDGLEVPLRFEIGELSVALADLKKVQPGYIFELSQPLNRNIVRIFAQGSLLGTGYLVAVGDRLGVRVSEFVPSENE